MNIAHILARGAVMAEGAPAIGVGTRALYSYPALIDRVRQLAGGMGERGIGPGDRVALYLNNCAEYLEIELATWWLGAAVVPINAKLTHSELEVIVREAEPKLLFAHNEIPELTDGLTTIVPASPAYEGLLAAAAAPATPMPVAPNDLAWLFFTSGTTGVPKGAMIGHGAIWSMIQGYLTDIDEVPAGAAVLHLAPLSHGSGMYALVFLACGGTCVVPADPKFDPATVRNLIAHWPEACFFAAPTMVRRLVADLKAAGGPIPQPRTIIYGGGPLYLGDLLQAADLLGPVFAQFYGQGECPMTITAQSRRAFSAALAAGDTHYLRTVGRAFLGTEIKIAGTTGAQLPTGAIGEIMVRSDTLCTGYWRNAQATEATFGGGWLRTGDLGRLDDTGLLTLEGRSKEVIITGGSNVYPIEVEAVLLRHDAVSEAAVLGVPHPDWGETVVACIAAPGADATTLEAELDALCRHHIARFKCPKRYVVLNELPKNAYGKIAKRELAAEL
ncbi:MAG: AMP-binding protein [Pseudomonadota bacterium]